MQALQENTTLQGGKYRIISVLGQGGFGITYLAEQTMLERRVAIKEFYMKELCSRDGSTSHVTIGTDGGRETVTRFREKFLKEARNIAKLNHPNIVKIIDVFEENGTAYYVMEYAEGGSLADKVNWEGYLSEPVATRYILQVAEALAYVHARKMNHLDVKPANIMLTDTDTAVLIDFGLSKQYNVGGQQTSTTPVGISEGYAPMEQYKQGGVGEFSPETDIYALGATFFKLLTGKNPPSASDVNEDGVPVDELKAKGVSEKAIEVICEAMKPRKKERMKDARGFINALGGTKDKLISMVEEDEVTVMNMETTEEGDNIEVKNGKNIKRKERFLINGPKWKDVRLGVIFIIFTIVLAGIVAFPLGLGDYIKKITQEELIKEEYSIEDIAKTLSKRNCQIESGLSEGLFCISQNRQYGFMNKWGRIVISCQFMDFCKVEVFSDSLALINPIGFVDKSGKTVIPFDFDDARSFSEGLAGIQKNGKWGFIDKSGKVVISCKYDCVDYFSEGMAGIEKNGKWGFIDKNGNEIIPCKYEYVSSFSEGLAWVGNEFQLGFIDKSGNEVIPFKYSIVDTFSEGLAGFQKNDKWGYIDKNGHEVIPCKYDYAGPFSEGLAFVGKDNKCGFIDKSGDVRVPFRYDSAWPFSEGMARVERKGKWGFIDTNGNEIVPCKYDVATSFSEGLAIVKEDGKPYGVIDKKGKCTYDFYQWKKEDEKESK